MLPLLSVDSQTRSGPGGGRRPTAAGLAEASGLALTSFCSTLATVAGPYLFDHAESHSNKSAPHGVGIVTLPPRLLRTTRRWPCQGCRQTGPCCAASTCVPPVSSTRRQLVRGVRTASAARRRRAEGWRGRHGGRPPTGHRGKNRPPSRRPQYNQSGAVLRQMALVHPGQTGKVQPLPKVVRSSVSASSICAVRSMQPQPVSVVRMGGPT